MAANHVAQLVVPWLLFAPQPVAGVAGAIVIVTQLWLVCSGNFAWLNALTITLALFAFDDALAVAGCPSTRPPCRRRRSATPLVVLAVTAGVVVPQLLAGAQPAVVAPGDERQLQPLAPGERLRRLRQRHARAAGGHRGGHRRRRRSGRTPPGGSTSSRASPAIPGRRPRQWAPYHLRLDWLMWFAALSPAYADRWFVAFLRRLLAGDAATCGSCAHNPFPDEPPAVVRARLYHYRFTTRERAARHR